jgi:hypothetical protein
MISESSAISTFSFSGLSSPWFVLVRFPVRFAGSEGDSKKKTSRLRSKREAFDET